MGTAAADLLAGLSRLGIELVPHGDRLRYRPRSALTPDLAEQMKAHKGEILAILRPEAPEVDTPNGVENVHFSSKREDCIDPPAACPKCGGLVFWWNPWNDQRCVEDGGRVLL